MRTAAARLGVALTLVGAAFTPTSAEGQTVQGQLVDFYTGDAIGHAFIVLRDSTDKEVLRVLTDGAGSFLSEAPATGTYRLQTAIIGWRRWSSPTFNLVLGEIFSYRMEVPLEAIRLDALIIEGERDLRLTSSLQARSAARRGRAL